MAYYYCLMVKVLYLISTASLAFKSQLLSTAVVGPIADAGCPVRVVGLKGVKESLITRTYTSYLACSFFSQPMTSIASLGVWRVNAGLAKKLFKELQILGWTFESKTVIRVIISSNTEILSVSCVLVRKSGFVKFSREVLKCINFFSFFKYNLIRRRRGLRRCSNKSTADRGRRLMRWRSGGKNSRRKWPRY